LKTRAAPFGVDRGARVASVGQVGWGRALALVLPCGLLVAGGAIAYPFSLNAAVAGERLVGLVVASVLPAGAALRLLKRRNTEVGLVGGSIAALAAAVGVVAAR